MNTRFLALIAAVPAALTGMVASSGIAQAALINGSQINLTISQFQVNAAGGFGYDPLPTGEPNGGANAAFDILFGGATQFTPSSDNRVLDVNGVNAEPGTQGNILVGASSDSFNSLFGQTGSITSFDGLTPTGTPFITVGQYRFDLVQFSPPDTISYNPIGGVNPSFPNGFELVLPSTADPVIDGGLTATFRGILTDTLTGETAPATFEFTGQGIRDDGLSGDAVANDGVTNVSTQSLSGRITVERVPEPSTLSFLFTAALMGLAFKNKATKS